MLSTKRIKNPLLIGIILLSAICIVIDLPRIPIKIDFWKVHLDTEIAGPDLNVNLFGTQIQRELNIKQGLDLQGGVQLVLEADMENIEEARREEALESVKNIIDRRVNMFGVAEPIVQTSKVGDSYRVIVELPGVSDVQEAIDLVGQTAKLEFKEFKDETQGEGEDQVVVPTLVSTGITGADLKKAQVQFDPQTNNPYIGIEFTEEGGRKFAEVTSRLVGQQLPIFLDDMLLSSPTVNEEINEGRAQITGTFELEGAKQFAIQLNAGALPVPMKGVIEQRTVGATLGEDSIRKSVIAGAIGLFAVMLFMVLYYGRLGLIADTALIIYGLITLAIYKIVPITLTMSGIAGFIISIGMAVDANILIFERMKEEMRRGKSWSVAMELGFGRAWDSIRDANICTLITGFILFNPFDFKFLNTSGPIRGFALTLLVGIGVSLFTGITVTRTLLRTFYRKKKTSSIY